MKKELQELLTMLIAEVRTQDDKFDSDIWEKYNIKILEWRKRYK